MPAYNSEKYIAEAIESILNQPFTEFEFIIINDGSTDNTAEVVRQYTDKRIKFIDNQKNQGLIAVLNQGLDLCRGEYIARMDSDDISHPQRFEKQLKYMDENPDVGVVGGWIQKFGETVKTNQIFKYPSQLYLLDLFLHGCKFAHPTAMIRTSVLRENKIYYNPQYPHAEDYGLWMQIARFAPIHNLQEILLNYRWHDTNVSVLHKQIQLDSAERVRRNAIETMLSDANEIQKLLDLTRELNQRFWLFGFLPIIRRKQYGLTKTKYYLFEKIPLLRVQNGKIYLFEFIKIGGIK